jgi:predicted adenylyl cyclase CyaB
MIEVEKKFILTEADRERLTLGAEFLKEKTFTDVYYDNAKFGLTTTDRWLRLRDGKWELKMPLLHGKERMADQYDELETEPEIRQALSLGEGEDLADDLEIAGYVPFATLTTVRKKFKRGEFVIDLDEIDFGESDYMIGEIELMVNDKSEIDSAVERIVQFAEDNGLTIAPVRGKVIEYMKRLAPVHYQAMVDSGITKDY